MATNIKIRVRVNECWGKYIFHILEGKGRAGKGRERKGKGRGREGKGNFDCWDSYFLRLNRDHAVAKYATSRPSWWESNPDL